MAQTFKRLEIKYLLNDKQYSQLLPELLKIAEVDEYGKSRINNIYYDTPDFRVIRTSLEKPVYKEKLRLRTYGDTTDMTNAFVELKKKYHGVVYKRRISAGYLDSLKYLAGDSELMSSMDKENEPFDRLDKGMDRDFDIREIQAESLRALKEKENGLRKSQVKDEIDEFIKAYEGLRPAMIIGYDRIAMAGREDKEFRVTFDTNITWRTTDIDLRKGTDGRQILEPGQHLMEIKIPLAFPLELSRRMSELGIFPVSISKYGRAYIAMIKEAENRFSNVYEYEAAGSTSGIVEYSLLHTGKLIAHGA